jgi:hypothetical protein
MKVQQAGDPGVSADTVLVRASKALERRTLESVIVLGDRVPIVLRGTAIAIWESFAEPCTVAQAATTLASRYDVDEATVRHDAMPVVEQLHREGALTVVEGPAR